MSKRILTRGASRCGDFVGAVVALDDLTHDVKGVRLDARRRDGSTSRPANMSIDAAGRRRSRAFSIANAPADAAHVELQIRRRCQAARRQAISTEFESGDRIVIQWPNGTVFSCANRAADLCYSWRAARRLQSATR